MNSQYEKGKRIRIIPVAMSTSILLLLLLSLVPSSTLYPNAAFGDGFFMEELSAFFGDRKADLIKKMTPPVVTTETLQNQNQKPVIQFKLYDPTTKEGYKHVTYYITIEKDGKKLLSDWFHDHKGDLKIEMKPSTAEQIAVYDGWLSVGSTVNQQVSLSDGEQIPIQVISYYDDIKDFNFDSINKQIQFTMPFNWNITRLEDQKQLMVHQEVSIPKGTPLTSQSYTGAINGIDVTKSLMVDPSNSTKNVVHFMLPKPAVIQIAEEVNNNGNAAVSNGLMEFSLSPSTNATSSSSMHEMANMTGM